VRLETLDGVTWVRGESTYGGALRSEAASSEGTTALRDFFRSIAEEIKRERSATIPVFAYYDTDRAVFDTPQRKRDFYDTFDRFDAYVDALAAKPSFKALVECMCAQQFAELYNLFMGEDRSSRHRGLATVRDAITRMLPDISNPRIEPPVRFVVSRHAEGLEPETLSLDQLSGGYRIVLALSADLARRMAIANSHLADPLQTDAIVLIDEVELHLHPEWQQRVLSDLRRTFPNAQFIVSTHSPAVLTTVEPQHILHLRATPEGAVLEQETAATFGARAGDVLEAVMHVNQRPDNEFTRSLSE
jgi:predicted ATP-binding protein involved in virulence